MTEKPIPIVREQNQAVDAYEDGLFAQVEAEDLNNHFDSVLKKVGLDEKSSSTAWEATYSVLTGLFAAGWDTPETLNSEILNKHFPDLPKERLENLVGEALIEAAQEQGVRALERAFTSRDLDVIAAGNLAREMMAGPEGKNFFVTTYKAGQEARQRYEHSR